MRFSVDAGELSGLLNHVKRSVPARTTIPVLSHVEVIASGDGTIRVRGTNLDIECWGHVDADVSEAGCAAVPGMAFQSIVSRFRKSAQIEVSMTGERMTLVSGRSRYDLSTLPLEGFPKTREPHVADRVTVAASPGDLKWLVDMTRGTIAPAETGYAFAEGLFLEISDGKLIAVSTDGKQMVAAHIETTSNQCFPGITVIPPSMAGEIQGLSADGGEASIHVDRTRVMFSGGAGTATASLVDSKFCQYRNVMPERGRPFATINAEDLVEALDRAMLAYTGLDVKAPIIEVSTIDGAIVIETEKNKQHDGHEEIDADVENVSVAVKCHGGKLRQLAALWGSARISLQWGGDFGKPLTIWSDDEPRMQQMTMLMKR